MKNRRREWTGVASNGLTPFGGPRSVHGRAGHGNELRHLRAVLRRTPAPPRRRGGSLGEAGGVRDIGACPTPELAETGHPPG
jgi:hypothetical protein